MWDMFLTDTVDIEIHTYAGENNQMQYGMIVKCKNRARREEGEGKNEA